MPKCEYADECTIVAQWSDLCPVNIEDKTKYDCLVREGYKHEGIEKPLSAFEQNHIINSRDGKLVAKLGGGWRA